MRRAALSAAVFECARLFDADDEIQRAREDGAERGLCVEGRIGGRDDADTSAPELAEQVGEVLPISGQIVDTADDEYVDLSGSGCRQHSLKSPTPQRGA
ncbi:MAG TPA: hypothetical protein VFW65_12715 [Pseudonocardiaceae bacterium]|nr:hypothetical protein [Pseudonocardiaceae bacterium]